MYFTEAGTQHLDRGPTYVLLHGLGGSRQHWHGVQSALSKTSYSIAIDVPGFGEDRANWRGFTVGSASEDIVAFCRDRGFKQGTVLVSHSIGSVVAGAVATDATEIFSKVVLVSGTLFLASEISQRPGLGLRNSKVGVTVVAQFVAGMIPLGGTIRRAVSRYRTLRRLALWPFVADPAGIAPEVLDAALENTGSVAVFSVLVKARSIDYVKILSGIPQPVSLLWGDRDRLIGSYDIALANELLTIDRTETIPNCGHWPMIEATAATARFIRDGE